MCQSATGDSGQQTKGLPRTSKAHVGNNRAKLVWPVVGIAAGLRHEWSFTVDAFRITVMAQLELIVGVSSQIGCLLRANLFGTASRDCSKAGVDRTRNPGAAAGLDCFSGRIPDCCLRSQRSVWSMVIHRGSTLTRDAQHTRFAGHREASRGLITKRTSAGHGSPPIGNSPNCRTTTGRRSCVAGHRPWWFWSADSQR